MALHSSQLLTLYGQQYPPADWTMTECEVIDSQLSAEVQHCTNACHVIIVSCIGLGIGSGKETRPIRNTGQ